MIDDLDNLIEDPRPWRVHTPENKSAGLSRTAQAALEDLAEALLDEGLSFSETTQYLATVTIQAAFDVDQQRQCRP